jgi:hypothetical protein
MRAKNAPIRAEQEQRRDKFQIEIARKGQAGIALHRKAGGQLLDKLFGGGVVILRNADHPRGAGQFIEIRDGQAAGRAIGFKKND